jgi:hypothetical protein
MSSGRHPGLSGRLLGDEWSMASGFLKSSNEKIAGKRDICDKLTFKIFIPAYSIEKNYFHVDKKIPEPAFVRMFHDIS